MEIGIEARNFDLEDEHRSEENNAFDDITQAERPLPHIEGELVVLRGIVYFTRLIKPAASFLVLEVAQFITTAQVITCRHFEETASNIGLTVPQAIDNPVHMVDLQEIEELKVIYVLEDCSSLEIFLLEEDFELLWIDKVFINSHKTSADLAIYI